MRWRLAALIMVPTVAGVVLGGARVVTSVESVNAHDRTASAAAQSAHIRDLLQTLGLERDTRTWMSVAGSAGKELKGPLTARQREVDTMLATLRDDMNTMGDHGPRVQHAVTMVRTSMDMGDIRRERVPTAYQNLITALLTLHDELSLLSQDPEMIGYFRGLGAVAQAKEEVSQQRYQLLVGYYRYRSVDAQEVQRFIASHSRQREAQNAFGGEVGAQLSMELSRKLTTAEYIDIELTKARAVVLAGDEASGAVFRNRLINDPNVWFENNSKVVDGLGEVEAKVAKLLLDRAEVLRGQSVNDAVLAGVAILLLLVVVLVFTVLIARSMVAPLRRLRTEALDIAGFRLPDVVRKLRIAGDGAAAEVRPIDVEGQDEIGEVAKAFDEVHRQAVRLAGEEAELRSNISSMFVNLSRRTQTLVERQISLIDGLEKGEQDGTRLADLFKLDHLATRMRRNSENLLVLAGHEPTRRRSQPAKLIDVVRASLSEVEDYERVQVKVHRATSVVGSAANDLVHLVAELVENAIQFSPKNSQVIVSSSMIEGGGALLSVSDAGIGMTEDEMGEANRRLAEPPVVDVSVSRRMGLFVVGRLALRHGIRVQLRRGEGAGLIAMVLLPPTLIPDGTQPQPAPQRPAFGGGTAPAPAPHTPAFGAAAQSFSTFGSFDSQDPMASRGTLSGFTADTDGGTFRQETFPSHPNTAQSPAHPGAPQSPALPRRQPGAADRPTPVPSGDLLGGDHPLPGRPGSGPPGSDRPGSGLPGSGRPGPGAFQGPVTGSSADAFQPPPGDRSAGGFQAPPAGQATGGFQTPPPTGDFRAPTGAFPTLPPSGPGRPPQGPPREPFEAQPPTGAFPAPEPAGLPTREPGSFPTPEPGAFLTREPESYPTPEPTSSFPPAPQAHRAQNRWPSTDAPSVDVSPVDDPEEFLPIFASVESAWFRKPGNTDEPSSEPPAESVAKELPRKDEDEPAQAVRSGDEGWRTAADAGWRAAAAASDPSLGGITAAGLPKRTPKANLVPGTAGRQAQPMSPMPPVSAERVRSRMASFQKGVRRGREEVRGQEEQQ
ncbi:sensor histidine kinase [Nonomuraea longicatena]|uniref:sensor histidine kinase n=1 Tax=Nonomuraea longicatena TaxID=83682 RepID=UPI0031DD5386